MWRITGRVLMAKNRKLKGIFLTIIVAAGLLAVIKYVGEGQRMQRDATKFTVSLNDIPEFTAPPKIKKMDNEPQFDKWIIITTVQQPTEDVKFLASLPGWRVVVVGDTKTPANWSNPNCVFLDVKKQESLGLSIASHIPYKSYCRKNIGYLYAIAHGAKFIYETDDDNRPLDKLQRFQYSEKTSGLMFAGKTLFNPYRHFGQSTLWPRGFPLSAIGSDLDPYYYKVSTEWDSPMIQQGVVNGDPDMDAIFRLTRKKTQEALEVTFDPAAPSTILPEGVLCPFNTQNTLFFHKALWALYLPKTTTFRILDIWRSYWSQRLLWEVGGRVGFTPPNAYQMRTPHSYLEDAEKERDMYHMTERLIEFLLKWSCPSHLSFFQCAYKLTVDMTEEHFWGREEPETIKLWFEDLLALGFQEPRRQQFGGNYAGTIDGLEKSIALKRRITLNQGTRIRFGAAEQYPPAIYNSNPHLNRAVLHLVGMSHVCPAVGVKFSALQPQSTFENILLVVVFKWPHYMHIAHLEAMYRPIFPNIIYCGEKASLFDSATEGVNTKLSFVEAKMAGGNNSYQCTIRAIEMGYNVEGYLVVGNDDIVNIWNLKSMNREQIWRTVDRIRFDIERNDVQRDWWEQEIPKYRNAYKALDALNAPKDIIDVATFKRNIKDNTGVTGVHGEADFYFIPQQLANDFHFYAAHYARHGTSQELAVPTVLNGLIFRRIAGSLTGVNLRGPSDRDDPWLKYDVEKHFLHPVKLTNATNRDLLCSRHAENLLYKYWS